MEFSFSIEQETLKQDICAFAQKELPSDWQGFMPSEEYATDEGWSLTKRMVKKLAAKGWLAMFWPQEYGGQSASPMIWHTYREEAAYHGVPGLDMGVGGISWVGPALMRFGTEEQKKQHLPLTAKGERFWCTGYSEPEAGSDLAAVKLLASDDGDHFVLNGQKVWTTSSPRADWCWLAVRTDPTAPKHKGISILLVDMKTPGITVQPIASMVDEPSFAEVFFEEVLVPKRNLIGEKNRGWEYLIVALDFERTFAITQMGVVRRLLDHLLEYGRREGREMLLRNPNLRSRLASLATECQVGRLICYQQAYAEEKGQISSYGASMAKNFSAELFQRAANVGMQLLGNYGQLTRSSRWVRLGGWVEYAYLGSTSWPIWGGTSEINRNVIAQRGLGLPRR